MTARETLDLTMAMLHSGNVLDLSAIDGVKADKHSTGGVGDKTSLVLCPMVAAQGVKIAKMSGRGLDTLAEPLTNWKVSPAFAAAFLRRSLWNRSIESELQSPVRLETLIRQIKSCMRCAMLPCTVDSRPLIVSSIMSKKLAAGADVIVLDVKMGSGAFMKTLEDAQQLAQIWSMSVAVQAVRLSR